MRNNGGMDKNTNAQNAALTVVANAILNLDEVVTKIDKTTIDQ